MLGFLMYPFMAKKNFLYPADWVKQEPYPTVNSTDIYYTGIANRVYDILKETKCDTFFTSIDQLRVVTMCIAGYFEDVISQNGIWQNFTSACLKEYGSRLPFFDLDENYYPDEINKEDIQFLLWHNLQVARRTERVIYPHNPVLKLTAEFIYEMLEDEYETAPENNRLHDFIYRETEADEACGHYMAVATWFHYDSFFNIENIDSFLTLKNNFLEQSHNDPEQVKVVVWGMYTTMVLKNRRSFLALTTPEWLARLANGHKQLAAWKDVKVKKASCYMVEQADADKVVLKDLIDNSVVEITPQHLETDMKSVEAGKTTIICEFVKFAGNYYRIGTIAVNEMSEGVEQYVANEKANRDTSNQKAAYKAFVKANDGRYVQFFKDNDACEQFLADKVGYTFSQGVTLPQFKSHKGLMLMASPKSGITLQPGVLDCVKADDNPFYNPETASRNALNVIARANAIPYDVMCRLQDDGMWPDTNYTISDNAEGGKQLAQKNLRFITDYYYCCNRKADCPTVKA